MRSTLLAGVIAIATAIAVPGLAQTAGTTATQPTQAAPAAGQGDEAQGSGEQGRAGHWMQGRGDMRGHGGWGMRGGGPMMRHMMMHGMMGLGDPQERCIDRLAWRAARRAYVEAKLDLTADQRPLWDKVQSTAQAEQQKERQLCQSLKPGEESTVLDRMDRAQQFLSARLDALQAARPAVQALYQALTPDQREVIDHPFRRW